MNMLEAGARADETPDTLMAFEDVNRIWVTEKDGWGVGEYDAEQFEAALDVLAKAVSRDMDHMRALKAAGTTEVERLRKTLAVAYDREIESDDANAQKIADLEATNARLREALEPLVGHRQYLTALRDGSTPYTNLPDNTVYRCVVTKAELEAAAQAVE